jgi:hypothetical protein
MKKIIFTLALAFCLSFAFGQTKKIAQASHSGSMETLSLGGSDNFGLVDPNKPVKPKKDTLRMKTDTIRAKKDTISTRPVATRQKFKPKTKVKTAVAHS